MCETPQTQSSTQTPTPVSSSEGAFSGADKEKILKLLRLTALYIDTLANIIEDNSKKHEEVSGE